MNETYQVIYCDARPWKNSSWNIALTQWHVLDCPLIGIEKLNVARSSAQELKTLYNGEIEVLIIGNNGVGSRDADYLYGIKALRGADARQDTHLYIFRDKIKSTLKKWKKRSRLFT